MEYVNPKVKANENLPRIPVPSIVAIDKKSANQMNRQKITQDKIFNVPIGEDFTNFSIRFNKQAYN